MTNSTYYEPEDLGPEQDAREAAIPGRKFYVYVLETDFGHYVGHTARLRQRINEHIRGDESATKGSNPRLAWKSRPLTTRSDAQDFEAALKSLCEQRSDRLKEIAGLEPEPFIRYKPDSDRVERQRHSTEVEIGNGIQAVHESEDFDPTHDNRRNKPFVSAGNNRRYHYRNDQARRIRDVGVKASEIDVKKALAWFTVVFFLAVASGYVLGFRAAEPQVDGFANLGIIIGAVALVVIGYMSRVFLQDIFGRIATWRVLYRPIEGNFRNTLITVAVASVLAAGAGGLSGYVTGLRTAQSVIDVFRTIGVIVFALLMIALLSLGILAYLNSQERRSRQTRRSRRRRRWHR